MTEEIKKPASKLLDWLPGTKDVEALEGIERELRTRKRSGNRWSFVLAALGVAYQVLVHFQTAQPAGLGKLVIGVLPDAWAKVLQQQPAAVGLALLVAAALVFIGVRFTSLLLTLSREPFRYSFSVAAFNPLPSERASLQAKDRLTLLPLDLTERIGKRIKRLSLLRAAPAAGANPAAEGPSHIAISGDVALREGVDGGWELFAMPRVRIGDASAPEALSFPVRFPLTGQPEGGGELAFTAEQYHQFCEHVYASVAFAIYQRIDADLEDKVAQFPTTFRRAVARLNEADDFAQSNTIDANERAEVQYRKALQELNRTWSLALARWACGLQLPLAGYLRVFELHAAILAGMARCAVTRSITANLAGRPARPSYAVRAPLLRLVETLRPIQRRGARRNESSAAQRLVAMRLPRLEAWRQARQQRQQRLTRALLDSLIALALAHTHADEPTRARARLDEALAIGPDTTMRNREYLWVEADLRPDMEGRIDRLRRLMEIAPDFHIGQFQLAVALEMRMRALDQLTTNGARAAMAEYERVLAINPGNVAALASLGYLHWLLGALEPARRRFEEGLALREVVRETFVGELNYGLARVMAELPAPVLPASEDAEAQQLHRALACFEIAIDTAPDLATADVRSERGAAAGDFEFIGQHMLLRFGAYRQVVARRLRRLRHSADPQVQAMQPALARLRCFVFNDAGNAAFQFHVRLNAPRELARAGRLLDLAVRGWSHCAVARVNRARHAEWAGLVARLEDLDAARALAPDWQRPRINRLSARHRVYEAARGELEGTMRAERDKIEAARRELQTPQEQPDTRQPALLALPGRASAGKDLVDQTRRREGARERIDLAERALHTAETAQQRLRADWTAEVRDAIDDLLRRFTLGRQIAAAGALPSAERPRPFSRWLADPSVDVEQLSPAEQELLLSALRALEYLKDALPQVPDEIVRACAALRHRMSGESWGWVNLQCDLLEPDEDTMHPADRRALKQARLDRLASVWRWIAADPVHSNALGWLTRLHPRAVLAGDVPIEQAPAALLALSAGAAGPLATPPARDALVRLLLELSAEHLGDRMPPVDAHPLKQPRPYWRALALAARRLAGPSRPAARTAWADWYHAAHDHLRAEDGASPLRRLRLALVAAGRAEDAARRAHWWSRCAEIASSGLIEEPDAFATARVDFAHWYALARQQWSACGPGAGVLHGVFIDGQPLRSADSLRRRFFDSTPPRDTRLAAVTVLLGERLVALVATADQQLTPEVEAAIQAQRADWQQRLGIDMPPLNFRVAGAGAAPAGWGLLLREVPTVQGPVDFEADTSPLAQLMAQVQAELEIRLPALVGVQDIQRLLAEADPELAAQVAARAGALPRLLALAHALLVQQLPLEIAAMARLVLDEAAPDFDRLVVAARANPRVRQRLVDRAAEATLWALPQPLQARLLDFLDGAGDSRCLALWPDDARHLLAAMQARAPATGLLGIVIDEPLLLAGLAAAQRLSNQPTLVLLRGELKLPQQFALKGEIDDVRLVGANTGTR